MTFTSIAPIITILDIKLQCCTLAYEFAIVAHTHYRGLVTLASHIFLVFDDITQNMRFTHGAKAALYVVYGGSSAIMLLSMND